MPRQHAPHTCGCNAAMNLYFKGLTGADKHTCDDPLPAR